LYGRAPVNINDPTREHRGTELAYPRTSPHDLVMQYPPGTQAGTAEHFMPRWVPVFAIHDGAISFAGTIGQTHSVVVDHENGWASLYSNLEHMFATPTAKGGWRASVKAGDVLGYVGSMSTGMFRTLHFELWQRDDRCLFNDVDPTQYMDQWLLLLWTDDRLTPLGPTQQPHVSA